MISYVLSSLLHIYNEINFVDFLVPSVSQIKSPLIVNAASLFKFFHIQQILLNYDDF